MRRPTPIRRTLEGPAKAVWASTPDRKEARPTNDGGKPQPRMRAGLDLGGRYSYLCLIDTDSGEVVEEGRLRTIPDALRRRFASESSLRIAIETGTHSPWVGRLL